MPKFELVSVEEAMTRAATGKRAEVIREYLGYIQQLKEGQAGKLQPAEGEKVAAVRRRLGIAAKAAGKELAIRRLGDEIYFWVKPQDKERPKRRGRKPRKADTAMP
jgi:hypothetical protein